MTDDADVSRAIVEAAERLGRCDIVVANAGLGNSGVVGEGSMERARMIVETNLIGAMVGGYIFNALGEVGVTGFNLWSMFVAVIGAVVVLVIYHALFRRSLV